MSYLRKLKITEMNRLSAEEFRKTSKFPISVILDNVRSMHNVGAVFRTSDAFLLECIYLCGITAVPPHPELHKTALGAEDTVNWMYFKDTVDAVKKLKEEKYKILAVEQCKGSILLNDLELNYDKKYAVILGNEVKGVQQNVVDMCDGCIEIPQFGTKHSLNVSVAAGIVLWEFVKKIKSCF